MADIPNTAYITVNANGIFVGGKPATTYRGVEISNIGGYVEDTFAWIQEQNSNITELHVMSSKTSGKCAKVGNPSSEHGSNAWCRVKYNDGRVYSWVFVRAYTSATICANWCASHCATDVRTGTCAFQRAVLGKLIIVKQEAAHPDIPNTEYITVNVNGIFVGGKPATTYRGVRILDMDSVKNTFAWIQEQNSNITELHVLSSNASGKFARVGRPSPEYYLNDYISTAWCRVKNKDGQFGGWVYARTYSMATDCAAYCAANCAGIVRLDAEFRSAVFGAVDKEKTTQKPINPVVVAANNNAQSKR